MTFTLIVAAMAFVMFLVYREPLVERLEATEPVGRRVTLTLLLAGILGGVASALVGSGADVLLYVCVVILCGISPRVGVPTSVVAMAVLSVAGLLVLGVGQGQLTGAAAGSGVDMTGLWMAAVPVVAVGAPLGSWLSARPPTASSSGSSSSSPPSRCSPPRSSSTSCVRTARCCCSPSSAA